MRTVTFRQPGPEDFAFDPQGPRGPRLIVATRNRLDEQPGSFWSVDLSGAEKEVVKPMAADAQCWPVGVALAASRGRKLLYVTNDPPAGGPSIEVFEVAGDALRHQQSLPGGGFVERPNDVAVLGNGDVFVSNLGLPKNRFSALLAVVSHAGTSRLGNVVRHRAATNSWSIFADRIGLANGITVDERERYLFVNSFARRSLELYEIATGIHKKSVSLPGHPDNLQWEVPGAVLDVALHPDGSRIRRHLENPRVISPSIGRRLHVAEFLKDPCAEIRVAPLYDLGEQFSGGSTALVFNGTLYVSQVMGNELAVIDDPPPV